MPFHSSHTSTCTFVSVSAFSGVIAERIDTLTLSVGGKNMLQNSRRICEKKYRVFEMGAGVCVYVCLLRVCLYVFAHAHWSTCLYRQHTQLHVLYAPMRARKYVVCECVCV